MSVRHDLPIGTVVRIHKGLLGAKSLGTITGYTTSGYSCYPGYLVHLEGISKSYGYGYDELDEILQAPDKPNPKYPTAWQRILEDES